MTCCRPTVINKQCEGHTGEERAAGSPPALLLKMKSLRVVVVVVGRGYRMCSSSMT